MLKIYFLTASLFTATQKVIPNTLSKLNPFFFRHKLHFAKSHACTGTEQEIKEELPEGPTVPLFTSEFRVTGLCQCPSGELLGIPTGLAAGCAKMILGSFKLMLLW